MKVLSLNYHLGKEKLLKSFEIVRNCMQVGGVLPKPYDRSEMQRYERTGVPKNRTKEGFHIWLNTD